MKIPKGALHSALAKLLHLVDAKASMPILRTVHLRAVAGVLTLTATDLTTWARASVACADGDLDVCVEPRPLLSFVKPAGRADRDTPALLQTTSGGRLLVAADDAQVVLDALSGADFPAHPGDGDLAWQVDGAWLAAELATTLGWVVKAMGHDTSRLQLCGVYIDAEHAVATDGHRLHLAAMRGLRSGGFLFPGRSIDVLLRVLPRSGEVTASRADDLVKLQAGDYEIVTKRLEQEFPSYEQVIPSATTALFSTIVETERLQAALSRLPRGHAGAPRYIKLRINGQITIEREVEGAVSAANVPVISTTHTGDDFILGLDAGYLADALAGGDLVTARFGGELDPVRLEPGSDRVAVVMPARL